MADKTISTDIAGLMEDVKVDATAVFATTARLLPSVNSQVVTNGLSATFPVKSVPAVATAHTEGAAITPVTTTISASTATLLEYPLVSRLSNNALKGGVNAAMEVAEDLGGGVARTVDTLITTAFSSFTSNIGVSTAAFEIEDFMTGVATLRATGFIGQINAVFGPKTFNSISQGLLDYGMSRQAEEFLGLGYYGTLNGVNIFITPWVTSADDGTNTYEVGGLFFSHAIGAAYRDPVIDFIAAEDPLYNSKLISATAYIRVAMLNAGAGFDVYHKTGLV